MTLLLLVLAATLLVGIGRASVRQAVRARVAADELQQRWGTGSCRAAVLPYAEGLLRTEEGRRKGPVPALRRQVRLGSQTFTLVVADEQAKANVNALLVDLGRQNAEDALRRNASGIGAMNALRLRPGARPLPRPVVNAEARTDTQETSSAAGVEQWISGYGQVFGDAGPAALIDWNARLAAPKGPAAAVSCWGDGGINVRRAPEALVKAMVGSRLSATDVGRLIAARDASFDPPMVTGNAYRPTVGSELARVRPLMAAARLKTDSPGAAYLRDGSACHSVWVAADDGRRRWYTFFVLERPEPDGTPVRTSFAW
jgi:hypothetical protein